MQTGDRKTSPRAFSRETPPPPKQVTPACPVDTVIGGHPEALPGPPVWREGERGWCRETVLAELSRAEAAGCVGAMLTHQGAAFQMEKRLFRRVRPKEGRVSSKQLALLAQVGTWGWGGIVGPSMGPSTEGQVHHCGEHRRWSHLPRQWGPPVISPWRRPPQVLRGHCEHPGWRARGWRPGDQ